MGAMRALIVCVMALALHGCMGGGLPPERVQAWVGRSATDLTRDWGAPTREVDDAGQRVLIYEEMEHGEYTKFENTVRARDTGSTEMAAAANAKAKGPAVYARSYLFWVDAGGKIVRAETRER